MSITFAVHLLHSRGGTELGLSVSILYILVVNRTCFRRRNLLCFFMLVL
jgi:hypothetical protein